MLLRQEMGEALRHARQQQGRTLRDVCAAASVSLGYLSEVERGAKEPSSELLAAICSALDLPLSHLLRDVTGRVSRRERLTQPTLAEPVQLPVAGRRDDTVDASAA